MPNQIDRQIWWNSWKVWLGGGAIAVLLILFLFRRLFCFYTFQYPQASTITFVLGLLSGLLGYLVNSVKARHLGFLAYAVMSLFVTIVIVMIIAPFFIQLDINSCVPDLPVLINMIEQEGRAVINEDMKVIHAIYDPGAVISRWNTSDTWQAYVYYSQKFAGEDHCTIGHSDFKVEEYSSEQVRLTTSSRGTFGIAGQGCTSTYSNPPGSDEWVFQKTDGEWKIISLEFNKK